MEIYSSDKRKLENDYQKEIDEFRNNFSQYKNKRIVLYGIGRYTATLVPVLKEFNFIGLMDRDLENIGKNMYGLPIISKEEAEKKADLIIINAAETYWKIIYKRICELSVPIYYLNGKLASNEEQDREYENNSYWNQSYQQLCDKVDSYEIVSFDIFDTLIMRKVYMPQDIFKIVEWRIRKELGLEIEFSRERIAAGVGSNDRYFMLDDIYMVMNQVLKLSDEILYKIKRIELQVERECCIPRKDMVEFYNELVLEKDVYLISDMYLPSQAITEILEQCGVRNVPHIWISGEKKANKKDGTLWEIYAKKIVKGRKALHIGDNIISDVKHPQKYGIETYYVMDSAKMWENSSVGGYASQIQTIEESIFAGLISAKIFNSPFSLHENRGKVVFESFVELGYCIFGGIIYSFLAWMLMEAKKRDIKRFIFFARDGYFIQRDYEYLRKLVDDEIPISQYLAISRRLILISSFEKNEDLEDIIKFPYNGSFREYMQDRFNTSVPLEDVHSELNVNLPKDSEMIKKWIAPYQNLLLDRIKEEKENYISYLEKINISEDDGMIDLWFYGNNQYYLSKLVNKRLTGFYFAVNKSKNNKCTINNNLIPCFQQNDDVYASNSEIKKGGLWIESFLTAPYGMIKSIGEQGEFICAPNGGNQKFFDKREEINDGVCEFVRDFLILTQNSVLRINEKSIDLFFGEFMKGHVDLSQELKKIFYYDNAIVQRRESKVFE